LSQPPKFGCQYLWALSNHAQGRQLAFFTAQINNDHTRKAICSGNFYGSHLPGGAAGGKNAATRLDEIVPLP
jgi:hypothetical protein